MFGPVTYINFTGTISAIFLSLFFISNHSLFKQPANAGMLYPLLSTQAVKKIATHS
jgi:hypothetical protein